MNIHNLIRDLRENNSSKIVLVVADGLGGLPLEMGGKTELESARTPNLDALVREGVCGLTIPVLPGITPGSGPGHLGLFGYDPLEYRIGRGILEALGINFQVGPRDVAVRGNFCTVDGKGLITDRRAGRPTTERCVAMCQEAAGDQDSRRRGLRRAGPRASLRRRLPRRRPGRQGQRHRSAASRRRSAVRGGCRPERQNTAKAVNHFIAEAAKVLKDDAPTNMVTLRGFARYPKIDTMQDVYGLKSACIAVYPMYKGLARLVGMDVARRRQHAERASRYAEKALGQIRLLLPALQVHRQHRRGRQLPRQG